MVEQDELKQLIQNMLVEPPGTMSKELVRKCAGLIKLEPERKEVRLLSESVFTEKERIVLFCLGRRLLSYLANDPSIADVSRGELEKQFGFDLPKVSAYASMLISAKFLERGSPGSYRARLSGMAEFLDKVRKKADSNKKEEQE